MSKYIARVALTLLSLACASCGDDSGSAESRPKPKPSARCDELVGALCDATVQCSISQGLDDEDDERALLRACEQHYRSEASCEDWDEDSVSPRLDRCVEDLGSASCFIDASDGFESSFTTPRSCSEYLSD